MSAAISVIIPQNLTERLENIARETERSPSFIIQKALESYIAEFADLQFARDRLYDSSGLLISGEELRKSLGV